MGLGNGNPKEGDKGSNFFWELKVLQGLEAIAVAIEAGGGGGGGGGITALTGDVTAGPGSGSVIATIGALKVTTPKIAANAVTFAKMQLITNSTFLGNNDPTTGAPNTGAVRELSLANIPYFSSAITGVANNANFLRGDGTWVTPASFTIQNSGTDLTPRSFVNFGGSLTAVDEGASPNKVTITGPVTESGLITSDSILNSAPQFKLGSPLDYTLAANSGATQSVFTSNRYINTNLSKLIITSNAFVPSTGFAATATISGGQLTNITITNPGTGGTFSPNSTSNLAISGGNPVTPATGTMLYASPLSEVVITNGGSNYPSGTTVTFPAPTEPTGIQATGTPIIKNGVIVGVNITNPGSGYLNPISVTFTGIPGIGATGRASLGKAVPFKATITNPGSGYTSPPSVFVIAGAGTENSAVEITNGSSGADGKLLRVSGAASSASSNSLVEFTNNSNGITLRLVASFIGATGINLSSNLSGTGILVNSANTGLQLTSCNVGISGSSSIDAGIGFIFSNTSLTKTSSLNTVQMGGSASGVPLQQPLTFNRTNTTKNVVAPTVPNNSTNTDGVGSTLNWNNPFYNIPRPDPPTAAAFVGSITGNTLNVTSVTSGSLGLSSIIAGFAGVLGNSIIIGFGTGSGGIGTYTLAVTYGTPIASTNMTATANAYLDNQPSSQIDGIWRNADYLNAQGGFDFKLARAQAGLDPRRPTFPLQTVMRLRADGRVTFSQNLPEYANETAALAAGLISGDLYRVAGPGYKIVCIVA